MRRSSRSSGDFRPPNTKPLREADTWKTLRSLAPYLMQYKWRVFLAISCLIFAKLATVSVPIIFKRMIDTLSPGNEALVLPTLLLVLYGLLRFANSFFTELREIFFARVTQHAIRRIALEVFRHLHALSLRFHLERQTGGVSRDIERGSRSVASLISYSLYSILPTLVELSLVLGILYINYDIGFVVITAISLTAYVLLTVFISNWRIALRRRVNETDSAANTQAIDSLLNYETVKYFNNEEFEAKRYDAHMQDWESAATRSQVSLSWLNMSQQLVIAIGVSAMMWRAAAGVIDGSMTIGDLVLVNAFLIQLYQPLNFLGVIYREIRQSMADIERMFGLLSVHREIADTPEAVVLRSDSVAVEIQSIYFSYEPNRQILHDVSFTVPAGKTVAVVGQSGSGKSTLARLLYRFYDINAGKILFNGTDIRNITQESLRGLIAIVPQDTVLFNDSIFYNIHYGRPGATREEVIAAADAAQLSEFIQQLPEGYETRVGERGLKLSGGEKQRVAIARALLKNPPLLIFDEATSALDSKTEKAIQSSIENAARGRTSLVIAHRLSTIMNADLIIVMENGRVIERGSHAGLLEANGRYAQMWTLQLQDELSSEQS